MRRTPGNNRRAPPGVHTAMDNAGRLVASPAVDGRQYVYRAYAPEHALLAEPFRET